MKINLFKTDFVGSQALSNKQLLSLLLLGAIYNLGVGYIFEHHTDLDVKLIAAFDWLI